MCFGSPKTPQVQAAPAPAPAPSILPSEVSPQAAGADRQKNLAKLRQGLVSTIKTSPAGITGAGADLQSPTLLGKKVLG